MLCIRRDFNNWSMFLSAVDLKLIKLLLIFLLAVEARQSSEILLQAVQMTKFIKLGTKNIMHLNWAIDKRVNLYK